MSEIVALVSSVADTEVDGMIEAGQGAVNTHAWLRRFDLQKQKYASAAAVIQVCMLILFPEFLLSAPCAREGRKMPEWKFILLLVSLVLCVCRR
jgi:hypothetical protein